MIADYILAGMGVEGAGLVAFRAITGRGPAALIANFAAGAALLAAWRLSEAGAATAVVCAALAAAGVAHVADLAARWREKQAPHGVNRRSET